MDRSSFFDPEWYLQTYPDVAAAGVDPRRHYEQHGRREGRLPCYMPALTLERDLWANAFSACPLIKSLKEQADGEGANALYANKVLCAFFLFSADYAEAVIHSNRLLSDFAGAKPLFSEEEIFLLAFEALFGAGEIACAEKLIAHEEWGNSVSKQLARMMLLGKAEKVRILNQLFSENRLVEVEFVDGNNDLFDRIFPKRLPTTLASPFLWLFRKTKVSVIIPAFNCENTVTTAIDSLFNQTWKNIEVIVVNDCSTDSTAQALEALKARKPELRIITNEQNLGAYKSRNKGCRSATGDFITVMDADDWAHPQKIEKQLIPLLLKSSLVATVSHWVRCDNELKFTALRNHNGWVHRNVSSLLIRAQVVRELGGWDGVRINADTEFYDRVIHRFGTSAIVEVKPGIPLSFGRVCASSLTRVSKTHLVTQFGGVRKSYFDYARVWHKNAQELSYNIDKDLRPFPAPPEIWEPGSNDCQEQNATEFLRWKNALDETWYVSAYDDVDALGLGLHDHFWESGEKEGRSPSPLFCPRAYQFKYGVAQGLSPTWHALTNGWNFNAAVEIPGNCKKTQGTSHVALFGHLVSPQVFGAERSLIDMARACASAGLKLTVFLPDFANNAYIFQLQKYAAAIIFLPLRWVKGKRLLQSKQVEFLRDTFMEREINLVYVNTITLAEPYEAARLAGVHSLTHVRELPEFDEALSNVLGEQPEESHQRLLDNSDYFIVNSKETERWINSSGRSKMVYNCVENRLDSSADEDAIGSHGNLRVCMLSSNVKKKGVDAFFEIANLCGSNQGISFTVYGPITADLRAAERKYGKKNVTIGGYVEKPYEAIVKNDVVLALSTFKESFGRTVAEAMTMGRVVVGYKWGAVQELVTEDTGVLVDFKETDQIVTVLKSLNTDRDCLQQLGSRAKARAEQLFSTASFDKTLSAAVLSFLPTSRTE